MKRILIPVVILLVIAFLITGCGTSTAAPPATTSALTTTSAAPTSAAPTTTASASTAPTTAPESTTPAQTQPTSSPTSQVVTGGILKVISGQFASTFYAPDEGPMDSGFLLPVEEQLVVWNAQGDYVPNLATSWDVDPTNKTITWHLQQGVTFQDGTPFNAAAVIWNYQFLNKAGKLTDGQYIQGLQALDDYTVKMDLTEINTTLIQDYGIVQMASPTAYQKNGGEAWAQDHAVGTGPFILQSFVSNNVIEYVKNPNYWRTGMPYLDGIEIKYIPDAQTAEMMMQAKEADMWINGADPSSVVELKNQGLKINAWPGFLYSILPNSNDPNSPFSKLQVRQAMAYAIDNQAIAQAIGQGQYNATQQIVPTDSPIYNQGYNPYPYDPAKAKQLLAEAGYPNGFQTNLLIQQTDTDTATAIKQYLDAVGINVNIDVADPGRYFSEVFGTGWQDLVLAASGINPDATDLYVHFGPNPLTFRTGNIKKSTEFLNLTTEAMQTFDRTQEISLEQQAVKQAAEDAMVIPLFQAPQFVIMQTYVHSNYGKIHGITWNSYHDWMEKH